MSALSFFTSAEHAAATVTRDIVVGARATGRFLEKAATVVKNDTPTIAAFTAMVDPRAAVIERIGAALIGQMEPQVAKITRTSPPMLRPHRRAHPRSGRRTPESLRVHGFRARHR